MGGQGPSQHFISILFKQTENLKELYSGYSCTHHLYFAVNILLYLSLSIHLSISLFILFLIHFKISCRNQYTSALKTSAFYDHLEFNMCLWFLLR